jgi:hypothetical protein
MEHWCDDTERERRKFSKGNLSRYQLVNDESGIVLGMNPALRGQRSAINE